MHLPFYTIINKQKTAVFYAITTYTLYSCSLAETTNWVIGWEHRTTGRLLEEAVIDLLKKYKEI